MEIVCNYTISVYSRSGYWVVGL